jgi:malonyl-CoA O-methyltransferase
MTRRHNDPYLLETRAIRRAFDRASSTYDGSAVLQGRVRQQLLDRLDLVTLDPAVILDAGCGTGQAGPLLLKRYRKARLVSVDLSEGMLRRTRARRLWLRRPTAVCSDALHLPLADASVDLVFSNLMLQWCNDLDGVMQEVARVLRPGGLFSFSTFGPDTLTELRQAWSTADGHVHVSRFIDMHDIGDALIRAGLATPVLDVDYFCMTYRSVRDLMRDLKAIGASNASGGRNHGLTGRRRLAAVEQAYEAGRRDGRLPSTWEVVYGHAWASPTRHRGQSAAGETRIPVSSIGVRDG